MCACTTAVDGGARAFGLRFRPLFYPTRCVDFSVVEIANSRTLALFSSRSVADVKRSSAAHIDSRCHGGILHQTGGQAILRAVANSADSAAGCTKSFQPQVGVPTTRMHTRHDIQSRFYLVRIIIECSITTLVKHCYYGACWDQQQSVARVI